MIVPVIFCMAWLGATSALAQAQEAPPQKGAVVEGVVLNALTGEPVRRAEVGLTPGQAPAGGAGEARMVMMPAQGGMQVQRNPAQSYSAVTGSDGTFRIENVPDGSYMVHIQKQGMFPWMTRPGWSALRIGVKGGAPVRGLRYAMAPQGVASGRVLDEEGEPVQGAQVTLLRRSWVNSQLRWAPFAAPAITDDRGAFRVSGLMPGSYVLMVSPRAAFSPTGGAGRTVLPMLFFPNARTPEAAQPIQVGLGQEVTNLDVRLPAVPSRSVTGVVLSAEGSPAEQFLVSAAPADMGWMPMSAGASARMQPQGRFRIEGLAPGRYRLTARLLPGPQGSGPGASATAEVDVSEGDVEGVEIRFQPPAVLTGRVVIEGPGAEAAKKQLQSLTIFMRGENWALAGSPAAVGEDGSFRIQLAFPGRHQIAVTGPAMSQLYTASIRTRSGVDAAAGLDIAAGSSEEVTIVLRTDGARLAVARAAPASPDESCGSYLAVVYGAALGRLGAPFRSQPLDAGGEAVFFPLPPGEYRVGGACVWNAVELAEPSFVERLARDGTLVRLKPGEQARVEARDLPVEGN